jgi:hypothetical protein
MTRTARIGLRHKDAIKINGTLIRVHFPRGRGHRVTLEVVSDKRPERVRQKAKQ